MTIGLVLTDREIREISTLVDEINVNLTIVMILSVP